MTAMPHASYLGDSLYADYDSSMGLVRVWASNGSQESISLHFSPVVLGALLAYATTCYVSTKELGYQTGTSIQ
jgi:hypothetical protein